MSAHYHFAIDPRQDLVRITMGGFFSEADIAAFARDQKRAYLELRCAANQHVTLVDMRAMQIQSQASVPQFQALMADPAMASRRIAFVVARSLARMQVKRATEGLPAALFMSAEEAEQWLMEGRPA